VIELSKRELAVAHEYSKGLTTQYVAKNLGISEKGVKSHLRHIYEKLSVNRIHQVVVWYVREIEVPRLLNEQIINDQCIR